MLSEITLRESARVLKKPAKPLVKPPPKRVNAKVDSFLIILLNRKENEIPYSAEKTEDMTTELPISPVKNIPLLAPPLNV